MNNSDYSPTRFLRKLEEAQVRSFGSRIVTVCCRTIAALSSFNVFADLSAGFHINYVRSTIHLAELTIVAEVYINN